MLKLYNTLTRKKEVFRPRKGKKINLFVCGITTYDSPHLGHARTFIFFDMLVKYLRQKGYNVFYLQNITDIDDKIIKRAKEEKVSWLRVSRRFEKEYLKAMKALKVDSITEYARATDHIKEIISQVKRLLEKGFAYEIEQGLYYDISKFSEYGKLSGRTTLQAEDAVSRIDQAKGKRNRGDFCLWKFSKSREPSWPSPWGRGRPGWHIEDTAITEKYFGSQYDIHGGGRDLIFPHHEAEIAQQEAISGKKPLVRYWLHTGFLRVEGKKMAKSLGNFITIEDFLKAYSPRILRFFFLKTHYRSPIDYSKAAVLQAKKELGKIDEFLERLQSEIYPKNIPGTHCKIGKYFQAFEKAMEDDFKTPKAIAVFFDLINKGNVLINKGKLTKNEAKEILEFFKKIDKFFNFIFWPKPRVKIPKKILKLVEEREKLRKEEKWQEADKIRKEIQKLGYKIEDTKAGPKIKLRPENA